MLAGENNCEMVSPGRLDSDYPADGCIYLEDVWVNHRS